MKKGIKLSLGLKFSVVIMIMGLLIGTLIVLVSFQLYTEQVNDRYTRQGEALAEAASEIVDWDTIRYYYETREEDDQYNTTLERLRLCVDAGNAEFLSILVPHEDGCIYIFDTDTSDEHLPLGYFTDWFEGFGEHSDKLLRGERVPPITSNDDFGWLLSTYIPFTDSAGNFVAYLGVDYSVSHIIQEEWSFIGQMIVVTLIISITMTALFLRILRVSVLKPINEIAEASNSYLNDEHDDISSSSSISRLTIKTHDELQSLSVSLQTMEEKIRNYIEHLEEATYRAETDTMTTLLNREAFERRVEEVLSQSFDGFNVFMMIDLDNFKDINDTYGHAVGDEVIAACAETIRSLFRSSDFVARMGGDEFAAFYRSPATKESVENRASAVCEAVRSIRVSGSVSISISLGAVVTSGQTVSSYQSLYIKADNALYDVKSKGRNGFIVRFE